MSEDGSLNRGKSARHLEQIAVNEFVASAPVEEISDSGNFMESHQIQQDRVAQLSADFRRCNEELKALGDTNPAKAALLRNISDLLDAEMVEAMKAAGTPIQ